MFARLTIIFFLLGAVLPVYTASAETDVERKSRLEAELQQVERQILTQQRLVEDTQLERQSLERDMTLIQGNIKKTQLGIQARSIAIAQLSDQIGDKEEVLKILEERLSRQQQSLADLVRKSAAMDDFSLLEV